VRCGRRRRRCPDRGPPVPSSTTMPHGHRDSSPRCAGPRTGARDGSRRRAMPRARAPERAATAADSGAWLQLPVLGVWIGAQLVRPDITQSCSRAAWRSTWVSTSPPRTSRITTPRPMSAPRRGSGPCPSGRGALCLNSNRTVCTRGRHGYFGGATVSVPLTTGLRSFSMQSPCISRLIVVTGV
jgi:hypothetical protein